MNINILIMNISQITLTTYDYRYLNHLKVNSILLDFTANAPSEVKLTASSVINLQRAASTAKSATVENIVAAVRMRQKQRQQQNAIIYRRCCCKT